MTPLEAAREAVRLANGATCDTPWIVEGQSIVAHGRGVIVSACPTPRAGGTMECVANAAFIAHAGTHYRAIATALIEAEEKVGRMREALKSLRRKHFDNEMDTYYSCPKTEDWNGCNDPKMEALPPEERECRCGADSANAIIDAALAGDPK